MWWCDHITFNDITEINLPVRANFKQSETINKAGKCFKNHNFVCDTFYHAPGIDTTPEPTTFTLHLNVTPNYCKWNAVLQKDTITSLYSLCSQSLHGWDATFHREKNESPDLEYLVLFLKVLVFVRVTLGKLVDVDPKLLDLLSDLVHVQIETTMFERTW